MKIHSRSAIETPDSSTETPDSSTETPNSETETPETPETPDTSQEIPDTPETPDSKAVVPNSAHTQSNEIDVSDPESGSGQVYIDGHGYESSPGRLVIKGENSTHFV